MTNHPRYALELCLAQAIDTKTEAAYHPFSYAGKRAATMHEWADHAAPQLKEKQECTNN